MLIGSYKLEVLKVLFMTTSEEIDNAIKVLDAVRQEAQKDNEYGFNDDWKTFQKKMFK